MLAGPPCASACQIGEFARAQAQGYPPRPSSQRTHAEHHKGHSIQLDSKTALAAVSQPYINPPRRPTFHLSVAPQQKRGNPNLILWTTNNKTRRSGPLAKGRQMISSRSLEIPAGSIKKVVYLLHRASRVVLHGAGLPRPALD